MKLIALLMAFGICALAPLATEPREPKKDPRIAFLAGGSRDADSLLIAAFWQRMKELNYVEGKNIVAEYRFAEGALERLPVFAAELVRLNVDVIVAPGSGAVAAKKATDVVPIVQTLGDLVGTGLVANLARPGGNVTGLSTFVPELGAKQLELLKDAFPKVTRVAVLSSSSDFNVLLVENIRNAAESLQVTLQPLELRSVDDLGAAFALTKAARADAVIALRNPITATHRARISDFAAKNRLPVIYPDREFVDAGGLMSYGVNVADLWSRAAVYVDKILRGAKPGELPVERPTSFELVINLRTAKALGLTIPRSVLSRADEVIE